MKPGKERNGTELRSLPLWAASRVMLEGQEKEFFSCWKKVTQSFQEDDIHDLRVASRRLREGLALFSPCFPGRKGGRLLKKVKGVTVMLGEMRNIDEACRFFSGLSALESQGCAGEVEELITTLRAEREQAYLKLKEEFGSLPPAPLRSELAALKERPNLFGAGATDPFMGVTFFAGGALMARAQMVAELLPAALDEKDSAGQHRLRIAVKKLRYRLEIIGPLLTGGYQELREALKGYQDVLGKLHDLDVFRELVGERVSEGVAKERLFQVLAARRKLLYHSFKGLLEDTPLSSIGSRAKDAL